MSKERNRAYRRHHDYRFFNKTKNHAWAVYGFQGSEADRLNIVRIIYKNRKKCSCNMCCNPRRSNITKDKRTMQEKKAYESYLSQIKDI